MPQRNKSALSEMGELDVVMCLTVVKFFLENEFHMKREPSLHCTTENKPWGILLKALLFFKIGNKT